MARTKKKKPQKTSLLKKLAQETMQDGRVKGYRINPQGEISVSDAISKIIAPYRETAPDYEAFHKLVTVACAAWNAAILPADEQEKMLADMRALLPDKQTREDFTEIVKELMKRKNKLYPHVNRMILRFKVTDLGDDFDIAVASTLDK